MFKQKTIRLICLVCTVFFLGVLCGVVSVFFTKTTPSPWFTVQTPRYEPASRGARPPLAPDAFSPANSHSVSEASAPIPKRDVHIISQDIYDQLISALFLLFLQAAGGRPSPDAESPDPEALIPYGEGVPPTLADEPLGVRIYYIELLKEKRRWDQHRQEQYGSILESWVEPATIDSENLELENDENMEHFMELERALALHKKLVRDVRIFHGEVKYKRKQSGERRPYQTYETKSRLSPFAREAALADAMQQAMSSLSVGMHHGEASEVMERLCDEFVSPVRMLGEPSSRKDGSSAPFTYNYNTYIVFAKKVMNYSESLLEESSVNLASSSRGELHFISRRLFESLNTLYEIGRTEPIHSDFLDLEELERDIQSM